MSNNKNSKSKSEFKTKKHFGQCFLNDDNIVNKIVELANLNKNTVVLEIGPGAGAMTEPLVKKSKKVIAYEIDKDVIPVLENRLKKYDNYEIINEDILKVDPSYINSIEDEVVSVSNLPYYITSPIIELYLKRLVNVKKALFMVQKEVADRLCANVGTKDYNAFSITVQYYAETNKVLYVPRSCFKPSPNVDSAVIEIKKIDRNKKAKDDKLFIKVVEAAFKERRKMLVNNLSSEFKVSKETIQNILDDLEIRTDTRAESLSIDEFIDLTNKIGEIL